MNKRAFKLGLKLVLASVLSVVVAVGVFMLTRLGGTYVLDRLLADPDFESQETVRAVEGIQSYVDQNDLTTAQADQLSTLFPQYDVYMLLLLRDGVVLYDSTGLWTGVQTNKVPDASSTTYTVHFADQAVVTVLYSNFWSRYYAILDAACWVFAALVYILLFTGVIRRRLRYVVRLEAEMRVLEGGDLDHAVPVEGRDELGLLAESINDMRLSILARQAGEERALKASRELIASMSHDLRTPLTALIGYLELLTSNRHTDEDQRKHFIESSRNKAYRIKEMTDTLFQYAVDAIDEGDSFRGELTDVGPVLRQIIDEYRFDLDQEGFAFELPQEDIQAQIIMETDEIARVFDNLFTNIRKYAQKNCPIRVVWITQNGWLTITVENGVPDDTPPKGGTQLGLVTCKRIITRHHGEFVARQIGTRFLATIKLPLYRKSATVLR